VYLEYDYVNPGRSKVGYINSGNDTVFQQKRSIRLRGNTPISIHLINYNIEALQLETQIRKGPNTDSISIANFSGFLGTLTAVMAPMVGIDISKIMKSRGSLNKISSLASMSPDFNQLQALASGDDIIAMDTIIKWRLTEISKWKYVLTRLNQLRYNTQLPASEIKKLSKEAVTQLSPDAPDVLKDESKAPLLVMQIARENADYLKASMELLSKNVTNTPASRGIGTLDEYQLAKENIKGYQQYINESTESDINKTLSEIVGSYQAIMKNPFDAHLSTNIDNNAELLSLNFYQNALITNRREVVHSAPFLIKSAGGISIINSIGISFMQFNKPLEIYSVNNGKIVSNLSDFVLPTISAYMHFLSKSHAAFKIGGHFGLGVPLSESKSISFQFGPTLIIGTQNSICINLGLMTGRVTRLGGGWEVGAPYTATTALPTLNRYEWGYHVGISFNMAGLLRK
jgi:hypothetical protein